MMQMKMFFDENIGDACDGNGSYIYDSRVWDMLTTSLLYLIQLTR